MKRGSVKSKKGISAVVATVLIILITVAAVSIVWAVVIPMIKNNISASGTGEGVSIDTSEGYTVYDSNTKIACVQVKRESGEGIIGAQIIFDFDGNSETVIINSTDLPEVNQRKTYCYNLSAFGKPTSIKIAPVSIINGKQTTGAISTNVPNAPAGTVPANTPGVRNDVGEGGDESVCTNGATRECTVGGCAGTQTCSDRAWGSCVKTNPNCVGTCQGTLTGTCANLPTGLDYCGLYSNQKCVMISNCYGNEYNCNNFDNRKDECPHTNELNPAPYPCTWLGSCVGNSVGDCETYLEDTSCFNEGVDEGVQVCDWNYGLSKCYELSVDCSSISYDFTHISGCENVAGCSDNPDLGTCSGGGSCTDLGAVGDFNYDREYPGQCEWYAGDCYANTVCTSDNGGLSSCSDLTEQSVCETQGLNCTWS